MADWVGCMAALLDPLVATIGKRVCAGEVLHADRCPEHARVLLGSCRGFLHAEGYAGFDNLFADDPKTRKPRLTEVAC
jgi:hypothetical protein